MQHWVATVKTEPSPAALQVPDPVASVSLLPEENTVPTCKFCNNETPCVLAQGLYEYLETAVILNDDGDLYDLNAQLRFEMYRIASRWIHGPIHRGQRKQLPHCVVSEIRDFAIEDDPRK